MTNPIKNAVELIRESKLTKCKRCGAPDLAWIQLKTSGKWCLVNTSKRRPFYHGDNQPPTAPDGYTYAVKMSYHSCERYQQQQAEQVAQIEAIKHQRSIWRNENGHTAPEMLDSALVKVWLECENKQDAPKHIVEAMQILALLSGEIKDTEAQ